jgi:hypothetical protein
MAGFQRRRNEHRRPMESVPSSGGSRAAHAGSLSKDNRFVGERRILNLREPSMQNSKDLFIVATSESFPSVPQSS